MHNPSAEPRPSIYYRYHVHQPWLPRHVGEVQRHPVVIVGSGPSGLVTALELARLGVRSVVLTADLQVSQGSRAIVFTRRSLEILQQVGVARRIMEFGLPWRFGNSYYRGQHVFRMEAPHDPDDRFPPMVNIQQQYLEEYLGDACRAQPLIELRWGNRCTSVRQQGDRVLAEVDTPAGSYVIESEWLVAADGGRSPIRSALGLPLEGNAYEGYFVIADIKVDLPLPTERLAYFDPEWNPRNTVLMHRQPQGMWRVDYQLPEGETPEQALTPESLQARIDAQLAMIGYAGISWEMDWSSVYSARALTLPDYVHGRILFVGDAAHLLPIFGVRGANTAFQDAQSLAWHLAFVVRRLAPDTLLANYSRERVGAAREIIDEAGKSTRFMTPPTTGFRLLRDAVLSLSLSQSFVRPLYHWRTSRPHEYVDSALNSRTDDNKSFTSGPCDGAPPRNVRLGPQDYLLDHLGGGFDLLYFSDGEAIPESQVAAVQAARARGLPLKVTAVSAGSTTVPGADQTLVEASGHLRECYGVANAGAAYLLRPDQHICARWARLDSTRLRATLDNLFIL
ncbi:MAG TPA: FAD-dependent monooxygenase [Steroidobacteraceae bacterium]|nr:FAD-dependent monooxygenase [Steroidobacteraceae bacterium]